MAAVEVMYLQRPAPSGATVHRRACEIAASKGWSAPSYATVRDVVRSLSGPLRNLRLVHSISAQINRILKINELDTVTAEVIATARESLIIGGE